jgi:hypothetical protein
MAPTPKWWRTTVFTLSHPIAAAAIGSVSPGATNISTNAARFSTRGSSSLADAHLFMGSRTGSSGYSNSTLPTNSNNVLYILKIT